MKGNKVVVLVVVIALVAIASVVLSINLVYKSNQSQNGHALAIEGTVAKIDEGRILVISGKDVAELQGQTDEGMLEDVSEAIWFSLSLDQLKRVKKFDSVRITYSQVAESFPGQASANRVEKLSNDTND